MMNEDTPYIVVHFPELTEFLRRVNKKLLEGSYMLQGGISIDNDGFYQAMMRTLTTEEFYRERK